MKASTARSIETIFWLGVWGMGIYWFANNILPVITQAIRQGVQPSPSPSPSPTPPAGTTTPSSGGGVGDIDLGKTIAGIEDAVGGLWNLLSGVSKKALIDNPPETKTPSSSPSFDSTRSFQRWLTEQARSRARSRTPSGSGTTTSVFGPGGSEKEEFFRTGEIVFRG